MAESAFGFLAQKVPFMSNYNSVVPVISASVPNDPFLQKCEWREFSTTPETLTCEALHTCTEEQITDIGEPLTPG
jgi:hypothetical protein